MTTNIENEFTAKDLFNYNMNKEESFIWNSLRQEILDILKKLKIPNKIADRRTMTEIPRLESYVDYRINFKDGYGFYIAMSEYGYKLLGDSPYKNREDFKFYLLKKELDDAGQTIEVINREKLEKEWLNTGYSCDYDSRKFWFEYTIKMLTKIYGVEFVRTIEDYTFFTGQTKWIFDKEKLEFVESSRQ